MALDPWKSVDETSIPTTLVQRAEFISAKALSSSSPSTGEEPLHPAQTSYESPRCRVPHRRNLAPLRKVMETGSIPNCRNATSTYRRRPPAASSSSSSLPPSATSWSTWGRSSRPRRCSRSPCRSRPRTQSSSRAASGFDDGHPARARDRGRGHGRPRGPTNEHDLRLRANENVNGRLQEESGSRSWDFVGFLRRTREIIAGRALETFYRRAWDKMNVEGSGRWKESARLRSNDSCIPL